MNKTFELPALEHPKHIYISFNTTVDNVIYAAVYNYIDVLYYCIKKYQPSKDILLRAAKETHLMRKCKESNSIIDMFFKSYIRTHNYDKIMRILFYYIYKSKNEEEYQIFLNNL